MTETITPRRFAWDLPPDIPKHWLPGNEVVSAVLNAYTILVPANEAFYIRTLKACLPRVGTGELRARCLDFMRQEAQHGVAHQRYWNNLQAQGYRFRTFERWVGKGVYGLTERISPLWLRVSLVSCVEHINAYLAREFLEQRILAGADPRMRDLMEWHFAEEIEHRRVAFDVLQVVAPAYPVRLLGCAMTAFLFYLLMTVLALGLLAQDGLLGKGRTWRLWRKHLAGGHHMARRTLGHLCDYLRPGFHPAQLGGDALAAAVLERQTASRPPAVEPLRGGG